MHCRMIRSTSAFYLLDVWEISTSLNMTNKNVFTHFQMSCGRPKCPRLRMTVLLFSPFIMGIFKITKRTLMLITPEVIMEKLVGFNLVGSADKYFRREHVLTTNSTGRACPAFHPDFIYCSTPRLPNHPPMPHFLPSSSHLMDRDTQQTPKPMNTSLKRITGAPGSGSVHGVCSSSS